MAEEAQGSKPPKKKKTLPTNCAETNARIRRNNWYYKNGKYFASKASAKLHFQKLEEEKAKQAEEEAAQKAEEAKQAEEEAAQKAEEAKQAEEQPAETPAAEETSVEQAEEQPAETPAAESAEETSVEQTEATEETSSETTTEKNNS